MNKGFDMEVYNEFKVKVLEDPRNADRDKLAVATWVQGEEVRVTIGAKEVTIGADDGLNMMEILLASFAACDVAMVGLHASFIGLKINGLRAEVSGHFNVAAYLGIEGALGPGYDRITITVHLDAPDATPEQLEHLQHICDTGSPVGDTLTRSVPIELTIVQEG
jgi:uncharacterized OsmC-like protein